MKLTHLTFGQLYKLAHATTLMRVERVYHSALDRLCPGNFVATNAKRWPSVAGRYMKVLDFLRGPELKLALRKAAAEQDIPYVPGGALELCRIPQRSPQIMAAHANIIYTFCKLAGAVALVVENNTGSLSVLVNTTPMGIAALLYRPGLKWKTIKHECGIENTFPISVFWWLNLIPRLQDDDRLNPAVWPCNTPDCAAVAESLVTRIRV